jgi:hypothetical protein
MGSNEINNNMLNPTVLNSLKNRIYVMERENNKTKKLTSSQMVDKIRQLIERTAENDN